MIRSLICMIALCLVAGSCKKSGGAINPLSSVDNNGTGSYLVLDSTINTNLNSSALNSSSVGIEVHYYAGGAPVDHILLYATAGSSTDTSQWRLVKSVMYTAPKTMLTVTGADLATALDLAPSDFVPGNNYTIYTRVVTNSGMSFDVNNTGDNGGSGLISGTDYHSAFFFTAFVVCPFIAPMAGDYTIIRDDWQDYAVPALIAGAVTDGPGANQLSLHVYPAQGVGIPTGPMIVDVAPSTGNATIESGAIGTYGGSATTVTGSGHVFSCTGIIDLNLDFVVGGVYQGRFAMVIQKN